MAALKSAFESMGFGSVRTVLASGNVIFESPRRAPHVDRTIALGLERAIGFPVAVITRTVRELRAIIESEPFEDAPPVFASRHAQEETAASRNMDREE